jgi:hypothetical protein
MIGDMEPFGPTVASLLGEPRVMGLTFGRPNRNARTALKAATIETVFTGRQIKDLTMARAVLAGLWLYHDFMEESHEISQEIETPTGSFWHGILHRREPDYDNARYWFRRVGHHPVYAALHAHAARIAHESQWDPFTFIEVCRNAAGTGGDLEEACRQVQVVEWWALFKFSYTSALGVEVS